jgi:hypothetical protein
MNSDESDNEVEQFPVLVAAEPKYPFEKTKNIPKKFSYASMAAKTQPVSKPKVKSKKVWPALATGQKKSWVQIDDEGSSDEEEEDKTAYFEDPFEDCVSSLVEDNSAW